MRRAQRESACRAVKGSQVPGEGSLGDWSNMRKRSAIKRAAEWLAKNNTDSGLPEQSGRKRAPRLATPRPKRRSALARHRRKCSVCRHRDRDAIERDFLAWQSPDQIAANHGIADHSSIYRHAHATGLFHRRARTIRLALCPIVEQAMTVEVTASSVIRAIELLAQLDADGRLIPPEKHVVHHSSGPRAVPPGASKQHISGAPNRNSNRQNLQVGQDATR